MRDRDVVIIVSRTLNKLELAMRMVRVPINCIRSVETALAAAGTDGEGADEDGLRTFQILEGKFRRHRS